MSIGRMASQQDSECGALKHPYGRAWRAHRLLPFIRLFPIFFSFTPLQADAKNEFIPFPQVIFHSNDKDISTIERHGTDTGIDFVYTEDLGRARMLAEFFISHEEQEMERLMVGWVTPEDTQVWLGRFHTAIGQWNRKYHHGAYLQTSILRPGAIEFEDDGGVIPTHATGVTVTTMHESGPSITHYSVDMGMGPELTPDGLRPLDILKPGHGEHAISVAAAVSRQHYAKAMDNYGLFVGYVRIPSSVVNIRQVEERIYGGYANYSRNTWHLNASVMWIDVDIARDGGHENSAFAYGYLQPEYWLSNKWTLYGRLEGTAQGGNNFYLDQIPAYVRQRGMLGARYQLTHSQALKFELATLEQYDTRFVQTLMQWTAAFP